MARDEQPYAFIRKGNALVPEMDIDLSALDGVAEGQRVRLSIKQWRNLSRLRAYWAMLRDCISATECAANVTLLHAEIKLNVGLVERVRFKGHVVEIPASIAIEAMKEDDMIAYFASAERYLAEAYGYAGGNHA